VLLYQTTNKLPDFSHKGWQRISLLQFILHIYHGVSSLVNNKSLLEQIKFEYPSDTAIDFPGMRTAYSNNEATDSLWWWYTN